MFSFFKIFKRKKEKEIKKEKIEIRNLKQFISGHKRKKFLKYSKKILTIKRASEQQFNEILDILNDLKKEKIDFEVESNLKKKILSARDNLVDRFGFIISNLKTGDIKSWEESSTFMINLSSTLKQLTDFLSKRGELIRMGFKKEFSLISNSIKKISELLAELNEILGENSEEINMMIDAENNSEELTKMHNQLNKSKEKLHEKEKELLRLKNNQVVVKKKIEEIEVSNDFKKKKELESEIENLNIMEEKLSNEINGMMNFIIKALKKYIHFYGGFISKEELVQFKRFIENPAEEIIEGCEEKVIETLPKIKNLIDEEKIKFDEKTKAKIIRDINETPPKINKLKEKVKNIQEKKGLLEKELEEIDISEYDNLKETLKVSNQWIKRLENEIPELKDRIEKKEEAIYNLKQSISDLIKKSFGIEVEFEDGTFN